MSDEVYGVYFGENWISVDKDVDYDDTLAKVHRDVEGYPGLYRDVQTYLRERIKEVLTGTSDSVVVRIFGPDLPVLRDKADEITEKIGGRRRRHRRAVRASPRSCPHVEVELDLDRAQRFGLKPGDVRRQTSALLASEEVSDIFLRRQGVRRARVEHPVGARQHLRREESPDRHARRRTRTSRPSGDIAHRADAEPHPAQAAVAPDRRRRERGGSRPRRPPSRLEKRSTRSSAAAATTPRCWASRPS